MNDNLRIDPSSILIGMIQVLAAIFVLIVGIVTTTKGWHLLLIALGTGLLIWQAIRNFRKRLKPGEEPDI